MGKHDRKSAARAISDSAQKIWLAGLGAFAKAQEEGSRVFDQLISEGTQLDARTRNETRDKLDGLRGQMEDTVERLRQSGLASLERVQALIDQRVAETIERLAVPSRSDFERISGQLAEMTERFSRMAGTSAPGPASDRTARGTAGARSNAAADGNAGSASTDGDPAHGGNRESASASGTLASTRTKLQSQGSLAPARRAASSKAPVGGASTAPERRASAAKKPAAGSRAAKVSARAGSASVGERARGPSSASKAGTRQTTGAVKSTAAGKPTRPATRRTSR